MEENQELLHPIPFIKGKVNYLTCNNEAIHWEMQIYFTIIVGAMSLKIIPPTLVPVQSLNGASI